MLRRSYVLASLLAIVTATNPVQPSLAAGDVVALTSIPAPAAAPTERWYFALPSGDEARILAVWRRLEAAGAGRVHVFLPDLIVCELPVGIDPRAVAADAGIRVVRARDAPTLDGCRLSLAPTAIERAYTTRESNAARKDVLVPGGCELRVIPLSAIRSSARAASRASPRTRSSPATRLLHQNAEFLAGNVAIQVVLPRSPNYSFIDAQREQISLGILLAVEAYQDEFRNADIGALYSYFEPTISREPLDYAPVADGKWITDCMYQYGFPANPDAKLEIVHQFNEQTRARLGADWAFAIFIANARFDADGQFHNARSVSWSYLGGPYIVTSYPAGPWTGFLGVRQILRHDIGHIFWALEEDTGPVADCDTHSGYLNVPNLNKTLEQTVWGKRGCGGATPEYCYMNQYDSFLAAYLGDACAYTARMLGVGDSNDNGVPDALDRAPLVDFFSADVETVTAAVASLPVRVVSQAVPNQNPLQPTELRQDYAARLKDISISVGGLRPYTLRPRDVGSDGIVADVPIALPPMLPGRLDVAVEARTVFGARSGVRTKTYYFVHLKYLNFYVGHPGSGIQLSWSMVGETFDAYFRLHRVDLDGGDERVVAEGFPPAGEPRSGLTPYVVRDEDVDPGERYEYYVSGEIRLPYRGGVMELEVESNRVRAQGAVPRNDPSFPSVSLVAPNPFRSRTWLSVSLPDRNLAAAGTASTRGSPSTPVAVTVYDVVGRRVSVLYEGLASGPTLTIPWDGTNRAGDAVPTGVYFVRVEIADEVAIRKVLLIR